MKNKQTKNPNSLLYPDSYWKYLPQIQKKNAINQITYLEVKMICFNSASGTCNEEVIVDNLNKMVAWNVQVEQNPTLPKVIFYLIRN